MLCEGGQLLELLGRGEPELLLEVIGRHAAGLVDLSIFGVDHQCSILSF